jgi:hypothetical protein
LRAQREEAEFKPVPAVGDKAAPVSFASAPVS